MRRCNTDFCSLGFAPPPQGEGSVTSAAGAQPPPGEPEARWTADQPDERVSRPGESAALDMIDEIMRQAG